MLMSMIILPTFLISLLIVARMLHISSRTAVLFNIASITIGLTLFSAIISLLNLAGSLGSFLSENIITLMPFIIVIELTSGVFLSSRILYLDFMRFLKLEIGTFFLTFILSITLFFLLNFLIT